MAKKIRFPLEMDNGVEVRNMDELRSNFSLSRVLEYIQNGKLITWLSDRYENTLAEAISALDRNDEELPKKVSEIFHITYDETAEDELNKAAERAERINRLREFTDDKKYYSVIDKVAFDQDELYDFLDEDIKEIYLCGKKFSIPLSVKGVSYIGINNPVVVVDSETEVDWGEKAITLEAVTYDEKYQAVVDNASATKKVMYEKSVETVKWQTSKTVNIDNMPDKTYLSFMVPVAERKSVERMYIRARETIENLNYDDIGNAPDKTYLSFMVPVAEQKSIERMCILAKEAIENINYNAILE